jgi:hypothetical protein
MMAGLHWASFEVKIYIYFFSANARSSGYSLRRGKMIRFIGKPDQKPYNT